MDSHFNVESYLDMFSTFLETLRKIGNNIFVVVQEFSKDLEKFETTRFRLKSLKMIVNMLLSTN